MARTTSEAVQAILGDNYGAFLDGSLPSLTPYIDTAANTVDDVVECATARGTTLSATKLELMERWLAAYYYTIMDPLYKSRATASASGTFMDRSYKDAALSLDTSGCLKAILDGNRVATVTWLGRAPSEQVDYWDRD